MTPFVPIAGGAQVELGFDLFGVNVENRLWFTNDTGTVDATNLAGLSAGVAAWHTGNVLPHLSADITLLSVLAVKWDDHKGDIFDQTVVGVSGGSSERSHSANVSVVVPFLWPMNHTLKRNKNYVPGIPLDALDGNSVVSGFQDALFEAYAALVDAARLFSPILTWRWVAASAYEDGVLRSEQFVARIIGPPLERGFKIGQRRMRLR